jgi:hypothetical protein
MTKNNVKFFYIVIGSAIIASGFDMSVNNSSIYDM